jgi:multiple sugar transport system substrate-binding protein
VWPAPEDAPPSPYVGRPSARRSASSGTAASSTPAAAASRRRPSRTPGRPQEDEAIREIVAAFEQKTGKRVKLLLQPIIEIQDNAQAALAAGQPPDFLFSSYGARRFAQWAYDDRLSDLAGALGTLVDLLDADAIEASTFLDGSTGRLGLYALPMGRTSNYVHVWNSLLEQAGFTLADIPKEWEAFWSFWCDVVQPAVRRATGRDDVWGVGLPMSPIGDTHDQLTQFELAYGAPWIGRDNRVHFDDPVVRAGIIKALDAYTLIWRKGCTPPDATSWSNIDNNKAFLAQIVVMTPNQTLSIPGGLRATRPDDYRTNAATIDWPNGVDGQPLVIDGGTARAVVFKAGGHPSLVGDFVRFLIEDGWLAHWLDFAGDRYLPPMRKLVEQPFWLNPSDPHRMRAAIQIMTQPHQQTSNGVQGKEWRSGRIWGENVWGNAVHRVVAEGISPEQAVEEAIARVKEILGE